MPESTEPWGEKTRVKKVKAIQGDTHGVGTLGTVLACRGRAVHKDTGKQAYGYVVLWDGEASPMLCFNDGRLSALEN